MLNLYIPNFFLPHYTLQWEDCDLGVCFGFFNTEKPSSSPCKHLDTDLKASSLKFCNCNLSLQWWYPWQTSLVCILINQLKWWTMKTFLSASKWINLSCGITERNRTAWSQLCISRQRICVCRVCPQHQRVEHLPAFKRVEQTHSWDSTFCHHSFKCWNKMRHTPLFFFSFHS